MPRRNGIFPLLSKIRANPDKFRSETVLTALFIRLKTQPFGFLVAYAYNAYNMDKKDRGPRIELRLSEEDDTTIRARAQAADLSISEYMRRSALSSEVVPRLSLANLDTLRRIGMDLNQVAMLVSKEDRLSGEIEGIIAEINAIFRATH